MIRLFDCVYVYLFTFAFVRQNSDNKHGKVLKSNGRIAEKMEK